ncbi:hypothetical protein [Rhizobium deserti]|uniref:hypothetical protein n=1 Tax=Rhizobium deserti TaxID=2547961 RepID=UPI00192A19B7|nr:hypothetical protein [Rhizobium deserti]
MSEDKVEAALVEEIKRQANERPSDLKLERRESRIFIEGEIDLAALAMAVAVSIAGGP